MDSVVYASYNAQVVTLQLLGVQDCSLRLRRGNAEALRTRGGGGGGAGRGGHEIFEPMSSMLDLGACQLQCLLRSPNRNL